MSDLRNAGGEVIGIASSVAEEAVADELVAAGLETFGGLDVVINNAGIVHDRAIRKMSVAEFDEVIATHLRGAWLLSRAAARAMATGEGGIINVVSGSALFELVAQSNYAAAKGGMLALTRALSVELARRRIDVNALPGGRDRHDCNPQRARRRDRTPVSPRRVCRSVRRLSGL